MTIFRKLVFHRSLFLFPLCLVLAACSKTEPKEAEPVVPVTVAEVQKGDLEHIIIVDGLLYPVNQASVMPKISAPVSRFLVNRGDHVRSGQLLATLENRDLTASAAENKGLFDQAESNYRTTTGAALPEEMIKSQAEMQATRQSMEAAQKLLDSRKKLHEEGALAERQVDEAQVAYVQASGQFDTARKHLQALEEFSHKEQLKSARSQLEAVRSHYQGAEAQLAYSEIHSPINGVVADRPLYPGEMASTGAPLVVVMDISRIVARVYVPVQQAAHLKVGNSAQISLADGSKQAAGKVIVVSPATDPGRTTLQVWVEAPNPGEQFKPGSSARVAITAGTMHDVTIIPVEALLPSSSGNSSVLIVGTDLVAHERKIQTGVRQEKLVQVLSGLSPGEKVITVGGLGMEDGAKVRIETGHQDKEKTDRE
jgi:HlyD family secretion protein